MSEEININSPSDNKNIPIFKLSNGKLSKRMSPHLMYIITEEEYENCINEINSITDELNEKYKQIQLSAIPKPFFGAIFGIFLDWTFVNIFIGYPFGLLTAIGGVAGILSYVYHTEEVNIQPLYDTLSNINNSLSERNISFNYDPNFGSGFSISF